MQTAISVAELARSSHDGIRRQGGRVVCEVQFPDTCPGSYLPVMVMLGGRAHPGQCHRRFGTVFCTVE
jgi:hypothetical protein